MLLVESLEFTRRGGVDELYCYVALNHAIEGQRVRLAKIK